MNTATRVLWRSLTIASLVGLAGCSETGKIAAGISVGSYLLGLSPSNQIEQIYYLGVFDPMEQVPPAVYRIRVHGQASAISRKKYASGWVPAHVIDSLGTHLGFADSEVVEKTQNSDILSQFTTGRRLMMFGPDGFREAPKGHRLVIVMGTDPSAFFTGIDESLGMLTKAHADQVDAELQERLITVLTAADNEQDRLTQLEKDIEAQFGKGGN